MDDFITATEYSFDDYEDPIHIDPEVEIKQELLEIDEEPEIVLSNKGGLKLIYNGYLYTLHKKQPNSIRWRCVNRSRNCRGSLITAPDYKLPRVRIAHNHKVDPTAARVARTRFKTFGEPLLHQAHEQVVSKTRKTEGKCSAKTTPCKNGKRIAGTTATASGASRPREDNLEEHLDVVTMKQEPEDEDDCFLEEDSFPTTTHQGRGQGQMLPRVRSHSRSLRAMANPSAVWAHFDLCTNDALRAQCRICGAVVVRGGANPRQCGTTNLHRHLRVHHGGRLIGRRYHVMHNQTKRQQTQSPQRDGTTKAIRIATQSLVRQMRTIAPAPISQQNSQQHLRQPKTLVLKTVPLKVKQVAPTTIKMPPRQTPSQGAQGASPNVATPQQPPEVCLRWNSYHSNMQNSFPTLLDSEQFVDVTLACEGRSLKCHKMILSSCSDYLAQLLRENPCQHPIILMKDLKFWEVEALVKFMYRGEVNVAHDKLPQLLNAAEALQVKGLAGPNPSSQNPKPPMLIPQPKNSTTRPIVTRLVSKPKENSKPSTSSNATTPVASSPKRGQKREQPSDVSEGRQFTKIRLQRPVSPQSPTATVKLEPLDIPLSPTHIFPDNHEDSSNPSNFENLISMHEEEDPGGEDVEIDVEMDSQCGDQDISFRSLPEPPDPNDSEDQMEFVPTDFLEQEPDIVEDPETICSIDNDDDDEPSKHRRNNGEDCDKSDDEDDEPPKKGKT